MVRKARKANVNSYCSLPIVNELSPIHLTVNTTLLPPKPADNESPPSSSPIVNHPNLLEEKKKFVRPSMTHDGSRLNTSVRFQDTKTEGRPSIYLFIFVNPLSGDCKGKDLIQLPIQHFRLRRFPHVQVEIHNILNEEDRNLGVESIQLVEQMAKDGQLPSLQDAQEQEDSEAHKISSTVRTRHIHVWSAGGDGTVMSVFEMLAHHHIDLDYIFFSCIPFGTGNDFSQVLGWGRTIRHSNILGKRLQHLEELITERLEKSEAARLDIWQVEFSAHEGGYVRLAGPQRKDGHDVLEIDEREQRGTYPHMVRKMCNYMSIGVQGYVGSGFEKHRAGNRWMNMGIYTSESAKWVFWRRFPSVTHFIEKIKYKDQTVLAVPESDIKDANDTQEGIPKITKRPIDLVIQNIPHIWGREIDLWGEAKYGLEAVENRSGPTDPANWTPQLANDKKMEVFTIENMISYIKKLANIRKHVSRIGQFESPFEIVFREPTILKKQDKKWWQNWFENKYKQRNVICIMCDGEFYIIKDPKALRFKRFAQIWTLGRFDEHVSGRLVQDEQVSQQRQEETQQLYCSSNNKNAQ
ncbi:ATP-NAD kinase-like domain-containing protein [Parasitella parasitica]|nr:ATP-NAD kinase-like domain-containing protein [Parasitella parasitica]